MAMMTCADGSQGYRVLHRPWAFVQWLRYAAKLPEDYVLMAEPDHIFLHIPPLWCASRDAHQLGGGGGLGLGLGFGSRIELGLGS